MSNLKYKRSANKERQLVNKYAALGFIAARGAGSKSKGEWFKPDVWAFHPEQKVLELVQIKHTKGSRKYKCKTVHRIVGVRVKTILQRWI